MCTADHILALQAWFESLVLDARRVLDADLLEVLDEPGGQTDIRKLPNSDRLVFLLLLALALTGHLLLLGS